MTKWIKNLMVSNRLRAANKRISELETEVASLKAKIAKLEATFIPEIPDEIRHAANEALLSIPLISRIKLKAFRLLKFIFNNSKQA